MASERVRLFCLPYAGAGPATYLPWRGATDRIDIRPVDLPGRGAHGASAPTNTVEGVVDALILDLAPFLGTRFALFGHSLGALLAFELARRLETEGQRPERLIVSGRVPPDVPARETSARDLSDEELMDVVRRNAVTPPAVLENPAVLSLFLPALRADMDLSRHYRFVPEPQLSCPITAFYGQQERRAALVDGWRHRTTGHWRCRGFAGGHFFPFRESRDEVLAAIIEDLARGSHGGWPSPSRSA